MASVISACPACAAAPAAESLAKPAETASVQLSLPGIHCVNCIAGVERVLTKYPGVRTARVNLSLKRASVEAEEEVRPGDLIMALREAGYEAHELDAGAFSATETDRAGRDLLMRLAVAGFASMNVMLLSVAVWSGATDATRDLFHWVSAAITLPAIAFSAKPFFANAYAALRVRRLNMDVPITLAILLAVATSLWETALSGEHAYFDAAIALTFFLLAGRYLDHRARAAARSAAEELTALEVPRVLLLRGEVEEEVPLASVAVGDLVRVRPGGRIPVDGIVVEGRSELDRSFLTGETLPQPVAADGVVTSGEVNLTGPLIVRATAVGRDTALHRIADLVALAESGRAQYTPLADRAAKLYAPGVHILAALAFAGWFVATQDARVAINIAAAVLIITCPCALGLAVPAVTTAASGRLFRRGLLLKHPTALERLSEIDTVAFDKTGTLTTGQFRLLNREKIPKQQAAIARSLAGASDHPLAQALSAALDDKGVGAAVVTDISEVPGCGVEGMWKGQPVRLGRGDWLGAPASRETASWLRVGEDPPVEFAFTDSLRPGAEKLVHTFQERGLAVLLLSGDGSTVTRRIAEEVGIADWAAGQSPQQKAARISGLASEGRKVLFVGDGLNDTAALASAHVAISPASALDAARAASDIVLLGTDLSPIADAHRTSRVATERIRQNFRLATLYNVLAVPLAVAGFATPLIAALAMSASSITVSLNALRLGGRT
ncbi:Cu2+-exporting ATPase [Poseidonocella pacifica]|uniref:Cu2+-exporting ATPase n=1 Tax=Poseidonocella pacifica TaxID=871651 RepID=A0A1I0XI43_9RHOB|nr:heavy metal translocating P-type ATPase [Poseidonocella pacifica]SFB00682.1 Cu2+-exporting ATPase [Poseidonocella pacifica]